MAQQSAATEPLPWTAETTPATTPEPAKPAKRDVAPAASPAASPGVVATAATAKQTGVATRFSLTLSKGVQAEIYTLADPYRIVVDLPDLAFRLPADAGRTPAGVISEFRYGQFAEGKARIVIDTSGPVHVTSAKMDNGATAGEVILHLDIASVAAADFRGSSPPASPDQSKVAETSEKPAVGHDASANKRPVIIIDPGHGGIDPGALGANSVPEKAVVLEVAKHLQKALQGSGKFDVRMTRDKDVFVSLDKRLKFSTENRADLFISLHADSLEQMSAAQAIRGATVYTLSDRASDEQARAMAEKENASDLIAGLKRTDAPGSDQVKNILIDLLKRETSNFSADFSNVLTSSLGKSIAMSRAPQRSAAFKVLKQSNAPSVLVELGYMSNAQDHQQMMSDAWKQKVAASITKAIESYFGKRTAANP